MTDSCKTKDEKGRPYRYKAKTIETREEGSKRKDARKTKEKGTHPGTKRGHLDRNKITPPLTLDYLGWCKAKKI